MASGNTLLIFGALHGEFVASNYATIDQRNYHHVLDFDDSTDESVLFKAIMPQAYAGGGLDVYIHFSMSSGTSGAVIWDVAFERIGDGVQDIDSDGFASAQSSGAVTVPGTCGDVGITSISFSNGAEMDSIEAGELFRMKVSRDADNGSDNAYYDAELHAVEIRET